MNIEDGMFLDFRFDLTPFTVFAQLQHIHRNMIVVTTGLSTSRIKSIVVVKASIW